MSGKVSKDKIAAFRVIPYFARRQIKVPENITDILDQSAESLKILVDMTDNVEEDRIERLMYDEANGEEAEPLEWDGDEERWWDDTVWP